MNRLFYCK